MRIIAGEFRRRILNSPPGLTTRPIPDRVKESIFSMLGTRITGANVLDLFCGSGAFGLEAVSRGATQAVMVERDRRIAQVTQSNIDLFKCRDRAKVILGDALGISTVARAPRPLDLAFFDPPYPLIRQPDGHEWNRVKQQAAELGKIMAPDGFLLIRTPWPFIFDSPEMAARREQLKLLASGKLRLGGMNSRGGAARGRGQSRSGTPSAVSPGAAVSPVWPTDPLGERAPGGMTEGGPKRPGSKGGKQDGMAGGRSNRARGKGSGGRGSRDRMLRDEGGTIPPGTRIGQGVRRISSAGSPLPPLPPLPPLTPPTSSANPSTRGGRPGGSRGPSGAGSTRPRRDDGPIGQDGWMDPEEIQRLLEGSDVEMPIAGFDDADFDDLDSGSAHQEGRAAAADATDELDDRPLSDDELIAELGFDPELVRKAGGLEGLGRLARQAEGTESDGTPDGDEQSASMKLDALLSHAHREAAAKRVWADLSIPGMKGPETHAYGSTAVHWYQPQSGAEQTRG